MTRSLSICLINPRFQPSFWGREHALPLMPGDKRAWTLAGGLPLLAALVPEGHRVTLIDESVDVLDIDALREFDVIGLTGMIVQRDRMRDILLALQPLPGRVVVGGPYASIDEGFFDGLCDAIFVGEADTTWPAYLTGLAAGHDPGYRHEQPSPTDLSTLPPARLDLLKGRHYMSASLQYSRGCPFTCEFCDIIVIFGRRPRVKTPDQIVAELDSIRQAGFGICFIVDDNFIGNKVAVKKMLPAIIDWQERHGYPLILSTEATLNLADDPDLMELMYRANFREVFVGIESPRAESLMETRKLQNIRGDSMAAKLDRIRDAGLVVSAGFIVGFDEDDADIFEEQYRFIEDNHLGQVSLGMLMALPRTPLHARLAAEGRLVEEDAVCNFVPRQLSRDALVEGCAALLRRLYTADAFFGRIRRNMEASEAFRRRRAAIIARSRQSRGRVARRMSELAACIVMTWRLAGAARRAGCLRQATAMYVQQYRHQARAASGQRLPLSVFLSLCILHWHHFRLTQSGPDAARRSMNYFNAAPVPDGREPAE